METQQPTKQPDSRGYRPRLERPRDDRVIAGVASGLARHLGVDPAWVRIGFVVITLFGGAGVLAYLIGWIAIPEQGEVESELTKKTRHAPRLGNWIGIGLIVLAALILVGETTVIDGEVVFAGALIVLGVLIYRGDLSSLTRSNEKDEGAESDTLSEASTTTADVLPDTGPVTSYEYTETVETPPAPPVTPPPPAPAFQPRPPRPRESAALGRLGFATTLIVVGIMGVGQSAGWWDPFPRHYVGAVVVTIGATLLIASIFGRARWLIALGLVATPFLFAGALLDVPIDGGFGEPHYAPVSVADLEPEYRLIGGDMTLDLRDVELTADQTYELEATVTFGHLEVLIPEGLGVAVVAEVDAGEIRIDGALATDGVNVDTTRTYEGVGLVDLDAHVGFGQLEIREVEQQP